MGVVVPRVPRPRPRQRLPERTPPRSGVVHELRHPEATRGDVIGRAAIHAGEGREPELKRPAHGVRVTKPGRISLAAIANPAAMAAFRSRA